MPGLLACLTLLTLFADVSPAQPVIAAVENNYSYVRPGLPNYGVAQGSIFVLFGSNLAATTSTLQGLPLHSTLNGVSVQFTVQGTITEGLLYYVAPGQIVGVLPSATPVGTGIAIVTSGALTSPPVSITVVESAIGIVTGGVPNVAAAFDANWNPLTSTNAANPGDTVILYATGAGPVSGDESIAQIPQNLSGIPLEVDIGGIPAAVNYHGRSIYPGLDQLNVVIPAGATGCRVSVVARSGNLVGNLVLLPIASSSRVCSDQVPGITPGPVLTLTGKSAYNQGTINLGTNAPETAYANAQFEQGAGYQPGEPATFGIASATNASIGSCLTDTYLTSAPAGPDAAVAGPQFLNAGPAIDFTGPNRKLSAALFDGAYSVTTSGSVNAPPFIPANGGLFTIDNGGGGPDIGAFSIQIVLPPPLVWTNLASVASIDRTQPLTVTWTGGNPTGYIAIGGQSFAPYNINPALLLGVQFACYAAVSAQQFTIPASVLLALPPRSPSLTPAPGLNIGSAASFLFTAPGLDAGNIYSNSSVSLDIAYR